MENKESVITWDHVKIAMAIAVLSPPAAFVLSYCYDWGLFNALGISYSEAPSSIADHIRTGLVWLPAAILFVVGFVTMELLTVRWGRGRSEEEVNHTSVLPKRIRKARRVVCITSGFFGISGVVLWLLFGGVLTTFLLYGLLFGWFSFALWLTGNPVVQRRLSGLSSTIYVSWPMIPFLFVLLGQGDASKNFRNSQPNHRIHISDNSSPSKLEVYILRVYGDWLLVNNKQDQIYWIKLDNVDRIEILSKRALEDYSD